MALGSFGGSMAGKDNLERHFKTRDPWVDVAVLHEPQKPRQQDTHFELGVGVEGYERGTGKEVIRDPSFKRPGEKDPKTSQPFED